MVLILNTKAVKIFEAVGIERVDVAARPFLFDKPGDVRAESTGIGSHRRTPRRRYPVEPDRTLTHPVFIGVEILVNVDLSTLPNAAEITSTGLSAFGSREA